MAIYCQSQKESKGKISVYKMKIVKENIQENINLHMQSENVIEKLTDTYAWLRANVYPDLNQDELMDFNAALSKWLS